MFYVNSNVVILSVNRKTNKILFKIEMLEFFGGENLVFVVGLVWVFVYNFLLATKTSFKQLKRRGVSTDYGIDMFGIIYLSTLHAAWKWGEVCGQCY